MKNLGMGVMLNMLGGDEETVEAYHKSIGKIILEIDLIDDELKITFDDNTKLIIYDDGQSCCEHRYMETDDDLHKLIGQKLINIELKDAPDEEDDYGEVHEVQFLEIKTDKDFCTISSHNEHNGYYGGFSIVLRYKD